MGKIAAVLFLGLVGCGPSECDDFVTIYCQKVFACLPGGDEQACATEAKKGVAAMRRTEDECRTARLKAQAMSCTEFRAFVAAAAR